MVGTRSVRRAAVGAVCAAVALAAGGYSAIAMARTRPSSPAPRTRTFDYGVTIGPFQARDGYVARIELIACGGSRSGAALVSYERGNRSVAIDHSYIGLYGTCSVNQSLTSATVKLRWGSVLNLDLRVNGTSRLRRQSIMGCSGAHLAFRDLSGSGSAVLAIHQPVWGRLSESTPKVELSAIVGDSCAAGGDGTGTVAPNPGGPVPTITVPGLTGATTSTTSTTASTATSVTPDGSGSAFVGAFNPRGTLLMQSETSQGSAPVTYMTDTEPDSPAPGVAGSMDAVIEGRGAFTVSAGDTAAQIGPASASFISGSLAFSATGSCPGTPDALNGTVSGHITVLDAVLGPLVFNGPSADGAAVGNADADFSQCR